MPSVKRASLPCLLVSPNVLVYGLLRYCIILSIRLKRCHLRCFHGYRYFRFGPYPCFKLPVRSRSGSRTMATALPSTYDGMMDHYGHQNPRLMIKSKGPIQIAIIGGTGLSSLPSPPFTPVATLPPPTTPWGLPSSPISVLSYQPPNNSPQETPKQPVSLAFLARHGLHHQLAPHEIPNQANIAALRKLGVRCVVAFSAVGSLKEEVKPRDFVVVDQLIDWTRGVSLPIKTYGGIPQS